MMRAVLIMLVAMSLIPMGDTAGKLLTNDFGTQPAFVAFTRFAIGTLIIAPFAAPKHVRLLTDWRIWLRGGLIAGGILSILTALKTEPIANSFGAFFIGPIFSYTLSAFLLKEPAGWTRSGLLLLGFAGVLLVVQPGQDMSPNILWAVLGGLFYGGYLTASKWVMHLGPPPALLLSQLAIGTMVTAPLGLQSLPVITWEVSALTFSSAFCSMLGNLLLIKAVSLTQSTRLAPFVYFQIIAATALGVIAFGTFPNVFALFGLTLLVLSGFATLLIKR